MRTQASASVAASTPGIGGWARTGSSVAVSTGSPVPGTTSMASRVARRRRPVTASTRADIPFSSSCAPARCAASAVRIPSAKTWEPAARSPRSNRTRPLHPDTIALSSISASRSRVGASRIARSATRAARSPASVSAPRLAVTAFNTEIANARACDCDCDATATATATARNGPRPAASARQPGAARCGAGPAPRAPAPPG